MTVYSGNFSPRPYRLDLNVWLISQDVNANTSLVGWTLTIVKLGGTGAWFLDQHPGWAANIDGAGYGGNLAYDFTLYSSLQIAAGTKTVNHSADGTKSISVSASVNDNHLADAWTGGTFGLPTIPRATTPAFDPAPCEAGTEVTISLPRASTLFTHDVSAIWGSHSATIELGAETETEWTPPLEWLDAIPNATSGPCTIRAVTKSGSTVIGTKDTPLTVTVPSDIVPDFDTVLHEEATETPDIASLVGAYVQSKTALAVTIDGAEGIYGSTITGYKVEVLDAGNTVTDTVNAASGTTAPLAPSGDIKLRGTITDSRGRTKTKDVTITVLAYAVPQLTAYQFRRSLSAGTLDENGTYLRVDLTAAVQSLIVAAVQKNELQYRVTLKERADPWPTPDPDAWVDDIDAVTYNSHFEIGTIPTNESRTVRLEIRDVLGVIAQVQGVLPSSNVPFEISNEYLAVGVGKRYEEGRGSIDAAGQIYQNDGQAVLDESAVATVEQALEQSADDLLITPGGLGALAGLLAAAANKIINGDFRVNQRGASSGASLASGAYFLDRWKSLAAANGVTWTGDGTVGRVLTIPSSKSIAQLVERTDVQDGDFTLVWTGTAGARIYNEGDTPGAYTTGGVLTVEFDGTDNMVVEFESGTLSKVALYAGTAPFPFRPRAFAAELELALLRQSGELLSGSSPTTVTFSRPFAAPPRLNVTIEVAAANAEPEVYLLTATSVRLASLAHSASTYVAGDRIMWEAVGYPA